MSNNEDPSYVKTYREYDTPDDMSEISAQELLDGVDIDLAHQMLSQYYSNNSASNHEHWSNWYSMTMSGYGQMQIASKARDKFQITTGDTLTVQLRYKGTQVEATYTVGEDVTRFNFDKTVRNELGIVAGDEVAYRLTKE